MTGVTVVESGHHLLDDVDLVVPVGEHLALIGPNGAGKTTLLRAIAGYRHPTQGQVEVLGERLGHTDVRVLRRRVGFTSTALHPLLQTSAEVRLVVAAARHGATARVRGLEGDDAALDAAQVALGRVGAGHLAGRRCATLSQGEWQRVQIARALVTDPGLLLLDEPMAGLDIGGREGLLADLDQLMREEDGPTVVMVAHHLEELPAATRRAAILDRGELVASGPIGDVLTSEVVSRAFRLPLNVDRHEGRWSARLRAADQGGDGPGREGSD
ncbi:MAG: ATP-binding cassette domain-containing protein [Nitriliruptorales bacterium]|nr:ATP-binding cassette domain-containing protein [Nitriliruptorales bacterium]